MHNEVTARKFDPRWNRTIPEPSQSQRPPPRSATQFFGCIQELHQNNAPTDNVNLELPFSKVLPKKTKEALLTDLAQNSQ